MVTSTQPSRAKALPWYHGTAPVPLVKAPPWRKTSTGRRAAGARVGVHTLRDRQSSLIGQSAMPKAASRRPGVCGAWGPNSNAWRTPVHDGTGRGGAHRSAVAYGMPLNATTSPSARPVTRPDVVATTSTPVTLSTSQVVSPGMLWREFGTPNTWDRTRGKLKRAGGEVVRWAWDGVVELGAIGPDSRQGRRFGAFGTGSVICLPATALVNERSIRIGAGTMIGPNVSLSAGMVPGQVCV